MRERHLPRLCDACRSPMARQEDTCWQCGTRWASEDQPPTRLTVVPGGASDARLDPLPRIATGGR